MSKDRITPTLGLTAFVSPTVLCLSVLPFFGPPVAGHVLHLVHQHEGFRIPDSPIFDPKSALTVEAWIRPVPDDSAGPFHFIVSKNYRGAGFALLLIGRGNEYRIQFEANGLVNYPLPMSTLRSGWWHVAGVAQSDGPLELFVNGIKVSEAPCRGPLTSCAVPLCVGTSPWDSFVGDLDEVRIWNTARTQEELVQSALRRLSGREPGLIAYWDFERTVRGKLTDRTGNLPAVAAKATRIRLERG